MIAATICPKCDYTRLATDTAPEWQCPGCGVAYNKVGTEAERAAATPLDGRVSGQPMQAGKNAEYASGTLYFGFLVFGTIFAETKVWIGVLAILMVGAFYFWVRSYQLKRTVLDVPTSKARSAAQGYVELHGTIESLHGNTLQGPLTRKPCLWYSYHVVEGSGKNSKTLESGAASTPFLLRDETGTCLVDPRDAWVVCDRLAQWQSGNVTYSEWSMRAADPVYAIGEFKTDAVQRDGVMKETTAQLRAWLRDPKTFFARFDSDRDGKVSRAELDAANEAARREAIERYTAQGGRHRLVAPSDNRPYIVANWPHDKVAGHFSSMTVVHLVIGFIAAGFLVYHLLWNQ